MSQAAILGGEPITRNLGWPDFVDCEGTESEGFLVPEPYPPARLSGSTALGS